MAARNYVRRDRVDNLDLGVRNRLTYSSDAHFDRIIRRRLGHDRRRLCESVGDSHLATMHLAHHTLHDFDWAGRSRHDASAQSREIEAFEFWMLQLSDEHRGYSVQGRATLRLHGFER